MYNKFYEDGIYKCSGCGSELYKYPISLSSFPSPFDRSETKFDSGCGWPAFYDEIPGTDAAHLTT